MEQIIKNILSKAESEAKALVKTAKKQSSEAIERAKKQEEENYKKGLDRACKRAEEHNFNKSAAAKAEEALVRVTAEQKAINEVFALVNKELQSLTPASRKKLITNLIKNHARSGDTVYIGKNDEKEISEAFIKALPVKNLKRKVVDSIDGGITLENSNYKLSLTYKEMVEEVREELQFEVLKKLKK
ncbi:MAG: V-type ATP synthase subunit E family protein [Firmicutes bacterium]|nr:V-type ATP synthase subunit E family protein [Bacillota bacterium]MCL2771546.1 V-type ATP synthase subunit E family protein [Bacillota bacterium]